MSKFLDTIGTLSAFFQLGKGGAGVRSNSGTIEARNAANSALAPLSADSLTLTTPLPTSSGGTGGNTPLAARSNLGVFASASTSKTAAYTIATTDAGKIIECDASSAAFAVTLPSAASAAQMVFTIRKTDSSSNAVTVTCNGSDTIQVASTFALFDTGDLITLGSTGVGTWVLLGLTMKAATGTAAFLPLGYPEGMTLSRNSGSPNSAIDIAIGRLLIVGATGLRYRAGTGSIFTKILTSLWSANSGNGGRFSGTVSANQWWHVFAMRNDTTGVVDFGFDTSVTGANKPSGWSVRRIGSIKTDGSSNIIDFAQVDDKFLWKTEPTDVSAAIPTTATLYTISTPPGLSVDAIVRIGSGLPTTGNAVAILVSSPLINDQTPVRLSGGPASTEAAYVMSGIEFECSTTENIITNTASQVRARSSFASYTYNPRIGTIGWIDPRGAY